MSNADAKTTGAIGVKIKEMTIPYRLIPKLMPATLSIVYFLISSNLVKYLLLNYCLLIITKVT